MNPFSNLNFQRFNSLNFRSIFSWILIFIPVYVHIFLLIKYSLNFPFEDDHRLFLEFFHDIVSNSEILNKVKILFSKENESRPILLRISLLIVALFTQNLNFKFLIFLSNIYTLLLVYVFVKKYYYNKYSLAIVLLSILNLSVWELYFRNDVAAYQNSTLALSIWLFYIMSSTNCKQRNLLFYLIYFVTPFGSGIGFLTIIICLVYSFIRKTNLNKGILSLIFLAQTIIFFFLETKTSEVKDSFFEKIIKYKLELINALMISIGGQFNLTSNSLGFVISAVMGLVLIMLSIFFFKLEFKSSRYDFEKLVLFFAYVSISVIVISRYNYWTNGYESVLCARYKIYGGLILAILSAYFLAKTKRTLFKNMSLLFFVVFYGFWFLKNDSQLIIKRNIQFEDAYNLENNIVNFEIGRMKFVPKLKYEYLKNNSYISPEITHIAINKYLNGAKRYIPSSTNLNIVNNDPSFISDFKMKKNKLVNLLLKGNFGNSSVYFVKIIDKNNKTMILNLFEKPISFYQRILFEKKEVLELNREFNLQYYIISTPFKFEVYGME